MELGFQITIMVKPKKDNHPYNNSPMGRAAVRRPITAIRTERACSSSPRVMIQGLAGIFRKAASAHRFGSPRKFYSMRHVSAILFSISMAFVSQTVLGKEPVTPLVDPGALPPSKNVFVFGRRIVYYDVGSGSTVVLLHGFGSQAMFDWGRVIMPLSQGHRGLRSTRSALANRISR